jgi:DNA-binding XRE family transcriptional regulator
MPILKLANLLGCDPKTIEEIESGTYDNLAASEIQHVFGILNIRLTIANPQ